MDRTEMWVLETIKEHQGRYKNELQKIIECPVCCEHLEGTVSVCAEGHRVCMKCKPETSNCPICNANFTSIINCAAENVPSKFDELKISLIDPNNNVNEISIENKMYIGTQTTDMVKKNAKEESPPSPIASNQSKIISEEETGLAVKGKGKFPCRIGDCTDEMSYSRMVNHIRYLHEEHLIDVGNVLGNEYKYSWKILYQVNDTFDRAIYINNMGIFFVKIVTNEQGDLYGCVQITNSRVNAKYFEYKLEVGNKNTYVFFEGQVLGSRTASQDNHKNGLTVHNSYVQHLLQKKKSFECILTITLLSNLPVPAKQKTKARSKRESL